MKVICTQENLRKGLNLTSRVSSGSTTLPILNNVLLKTDQGVLKVSSTNLEMGINTWIRCKVDEEGGVSVPAKTFADLVNNLPSGNVTLTLKDNVLHIDADNYSTKIKGLAPDEFPLIPQIEDDAPIEMDGTDLKKAISQVSFAVAYSETQPEISGVLFSFENEILKLVATDRYRLAEKALKINSGITKAVIIPNRAVQELSKLLSTHDVTVHAFFSQNQAMFKLGETEIITRLIDAQYPDYKQIIPKEFNTEIELSTEDLTQAMRTAGIFTQTGNNVSMQFEEPGKLTLSSSSGDIGESQVNIPCTVEGDSGTIIFNHKYILDCLNAIGTEKVCFRIINENSPAVLTSNQLKDYVYLVMPIKV